MRKRGGSTAVTAILIYGQKLIVAHVGDSRAFVCRNGSAKPITVDHEPEKKKELVEGRGGFVVQMPGPSKTYESANKYSVVFQ